MPNTLYTLTTNLTLESALTLDSDIVYALQQATLLISGKLQQFADDSAFGDKIQVAFGTAVNTDELQSQWQAGDLTGFPIMEIVSGNHLNGANGAYAIANNRIYLSYEFLSQNQGNLGAIVALLLEEYGHSVDRVLNSTDALGDEGRIFASLVMGESLSEIELAQLKAEDDRGVIRVNGETTVVERNVSPDGGGNTLATATDIGNLSNTSTIVNDFVGIINPLNPDLRDYYNFQISGNSTVNLKLSGLSADANLTLFNSDGLNIAFSGQSGSVDENIIRNLAAGTYFVLVESANEASSTDYRLEAKAILLGPDQGGNNRATATDIGAITSTPKIVNDFIGNFNGLLTDNNDFYKFQITEANTAINLKLSGLNADASLTLLRNDGAILQTSNLSGNADENIIRSLTIGTYYVQVASSGNGTTYQLEAKTSSTPEDKGGNTLATATDIGAITSTPKIINDFIGNFNGLFTDRYDFYKFQITEASSINVKLSGLNANASLTLLRNDGGILRSSNVGGNADENITRNLLAGTYIAQVENSGNGTNYQLEIKADSLNYFDNAGDTLANARDIGILKGSQTFNDFIGNLFGLVQDNADFYRFEVTEGSSFNLSLGGLSANTNASLRLLNSQGELIRSSTNNTINSSLLAGTYYFQISPTSPNGTPYNITATANPIPDFAGNTIDQARNIGLLSGTQTFIDFIGDADRDDFYRFELLNNSQVNLGLSPERLGATTLLNLLDSKGNRVDFSAANVSKNLEAGVYYAQVSGDNTNYTVAFSAIANAPSPFQITGITPVVGSNIGESTITIKGSQFTTNALVSIIAPDGTEALAKSVKFQDQSTLTATFDLVGLNTGAYDVKVVDTPGTAQADDLFQVNIGNPGRLEVFVSSPSALRPWSTGEVVITYRNSGNTNITAPLLTLTAEGGLFEDSGRYRDNTVQFLAINPEGDAGVLAPGATGTFKIKFRFSDNGVSEINFTVYSLVASEVIDWNAFQEDTRPESIPAETWAVIFNNFVNEVGGKAENFEKVLAENASRLSDLGERTGDVSKLLAFEYQQVNGQGIFERFNLGSFGRGSSNFWDIKATTNSDGDVTIQNGGSLRVFEKQANGSYKPEAGDNGVITLENGAYRLREQDGTVIAFRTDGKLDFVRDTNSNQVTAGYTTDKLTTLTYTNGDVITFDYNSQGRISKVTDQFGQETTYIYDGTGERLLSVTDAGGTISYTYETDGAKANAIKSITFPDGTQRLYEYDAQGRVIKESLNGGAESVTYTYDAVGGVTVTDAQGNTSQLVQNAAGQVSRVTDALNRVTEFRYDETGNLTRIIAPGNNLSAFNYDSRGNLLSATDPLGQRVEFTYDQQFDQIQTVRDQRGNEIRYTYDAQGNLGRIIYADGSSEAFSYNSEGDVTISVNRRGEDIDYTYDSRGLLTKKVFADGTQATFAYDSRGNLTQATDADSSVTYGYDIANRLTKVTYGTGRFLSFSYDAGGRRTQMVDQDGFTTNYQYDAVGRLQKLTDGNGANIITYSYDSVGRLAREDNGNGTYTTYSYDVADQLTSIVNYRANNTINSRFDYTYDSLGRRTSSTTLEGTTTYGYDATGQLISVVLPNNRTISYQYDAAGNRISVQDSGATTAYSTNNLNQYTNVGAATYRYDTDGNLISKTQGGQTSTYSYDTENRLIQVVTPGGTWRYEYDALGNRIASIKDGQRTEYLLDPTGIGDVVGEYSSGNVARYTHGLGLVSRVDGSNAASFYDTDAIGSVVGLSGTSGAYLNRYSYL